MALVRQRWYQLPGGQVMHLFFWVDGVPMQVCMWRAAKSLDMGGALTSAPRCWRCEHRPHPKAQEYMP